METETKQIKRIGWQTYVLSKLRCHKSGLEQALEDVQMGRVCGPFHSMEELWESLNK